VARNLLAEREAVVKAQGASVYILGWFALAAAVVAGSYAAGSWPGAVVRFIPELIPGGWLVPLMLFIGFVAWAIDIISDLTPNQVAITYGFTGPVLAASKDANGTLASRISEWSATLQHSVGGQIAGWVGNVGAGALSIALMAMAVIIGRRVLQKQSAGAGRGAGGGGR
jgi:hypothetical protein